MLLVSFRLSKFTATEKADLKNIEAEQRETELRFHQWRLGGLRPDRPGYLTTLWCVLRG